MACDGGGKVSGPDSVILTRIYKRESIPLRVPVPIKWEVNSWLLSHHPKPSKNTLLTKIVTLTRNFQPDVLNFHLQISHLLPQSTKLQLEILTCCLYPQAIQYLS